MMFDESDQNVGSAGDSGSEAPREGDKAPDNAAA